MFRATQACLRVVSPTLQRHANRATSPLACAPEMSTNASSKDSKVSKKSTKSTKASSSQSSKEVPAAAAEPVDTGDSYRAGETFFSHNPYSFYDIENSVLPHRCPQPSSEKMEEFCLEKLNPEEKIEPRKLLAEDYGDLEEYPDKPVPKKVEKPVRPVMQRVYNVAPSSDVKDGKPCRARMPLTRPCWSDISPSGPDLAAPISRLQDQILLLRYLAFRTRPCWSDISPSGPDLAGPISRLIRDLDADY
ncbi:hypothetical protein ElyMa_004995900 [Elysia marginata]|uniref:NADH dehydrogenase [ubiquinone] flavoprotein 3, mitochondrial n=1 Tax=Elysia marginata TaxID=1093978 RepID=A0AAV4JBK1_9GAST|nr:hypothetical protein ElyMa_004995900 [Elysia marginata]